VHNTRIRDDGSVVFKHHLASPPPGARLDFDLASPGPRLRRRRIPAACPRQHRFLSPDVVEEFRTRVPRAVLVELDAGHNVHEQRPVELAAAIAAFVD